MLASWVFSPLLLSSNKIMMQPFSDVFACAMVQIMHIHIVCNVACCYQLENKESFTIFYQPLSKLLTFYHNQNYVPNLTLTLLSHKMLMCTFTSHISLFITFYLALFLLSRNVHSPLLLHTSTQPVNQRMGILVLVAAT